MTIKYTPCDLFHFLRKFPEKLRAISWDWVMGLMGMIPRYFLIASESKGINLWVFTHRLFRIPRWLWCLQLATGRALASFRNFRSVCKASFILTGQVAVCQGIEGPKTEMDFLIKQWPCSWFLNCKVWILLSQYLPYPVTPGGKGGASQGREL